MKSEYLNMNNVDIVNGVYFYGKSVDKAEDIFWGGDKAYLQKSENWSNWRKANFEFFKENLKSKPYGVLLDVGAGQQHFIELTKKFEVIAVDAIANPGIDVVCDLNMPLPFQDDTFDIIFMSNVLEHIHEPQSLLSELNRILKQGGFMVGTVPFLMSSHQRPHDYFRYTDLALIKLLAQSGFSKVDVIPLGTSLDVLASMEHKFYGTVETTLINRIAKRIFRFVDKIVFFLKTKIFIKSITPNVTYTCGYGFLGYKNKIKKLI